MGSGPVTLLGHRVLRVYQQIGMLNSPLGRHSSCSDHEQSFQKPALVCPPAVQSRISICSYLSSFVASWVWEHQLLKIWQFAQCRPWSLSLSTSILKYLSLTLLSPSPLIPSSTTSPVANPVGDFLSLHVSPNVFVLPKPRSMLSPSLISVKLPLWFAFYFFGFLSLLDSSACPLNVGILQGSDLNFIPFLFILSLDILTMFHSISYTVTLIWWWLTKSRSVYISVPRTVYLTAYSTFFTWCSTSDPTWLRPNSSFL